MLRLLPRLPAPVVRIRRPAMVLAFSFLLLGGCATYTDVTEEMRLALARGAPEQALRAVNEELDVDSEADLPEKLDSNRVLLLLERGTILFGLGEHRLSARDWQLADDRLEWLELDGADAADLARWLYSESSVPYRAPPWERLLLNQLNLVNHLAMGNAEGARVEARRFRVLEEQYVDEKGETLLPELLGLGNYLAAMAFEAGRGYQDALHHYRRAQARGFPDDGLAERIRALESMPVDEYERRFRVGDLLVVGGTGMVPAKHPQRMPIGLALSFLAAHGQHGGMSDRERDRLNRLVADGLVKWINFPELIRPPGFAAPLSTVHVGDRRLGPGAAVDVAAQVEAGFERMKPTLVIAALSRLVARAIAGYGTRVATEGAVKSGGGSSGTSDVVGWLAGLFVEGALTALDKPDTRSWTTLPGRIHLVRTNLPPGDHLVSVTVGGRIEDRVVRVEEVGPTVAVFGLR